MHYYTSYSRESVLSGSLDIVTCQGNKAYCHIYINPCIYRYWNPLTNFLFSGGEFLLLRKILFVSLWNSFECATFLNFVYYSEGAGVSRLTSVTILCYKPLKSVYYVPKYLKYDILTNQTWRCNEQFSIPAHTNTFAKLIHSMYVPMHGICWVPAAPYLCMCMWWLCGCLCSSVVFWQILRRCMGGCWMLVLCCVCECVSVAACMSASVSLFVSVLMNYTRHVQMSKYWCFGWGWRTHVAEAQCLRWICEARHRTTCITDHSISHTRPDKLSHGAAHLTHSNGGWLSWQADVLTKPFTDIVILQTCLYLQRERRRFIRAFTRTHVHTAVTSMERIAACKIFLSPRNCP